MQTRVTELLGIETPILQGAMARVADGALVGAVGAAGGLGILGSGSAGANWVSEQIDIARSITDGPIGVNLMLMSLKSDDLAQVVIDKGVEVVTTGAGDPRKYMNAWLDAGIKVVPVVASAVLASRMERAGASAVVAEGAEAGGHVGRIHTMALIPQVVDAVDIPVIAAGGIADGRGVAAAFCLGAEGVQLGTRFVVADECWVDDAYKDRILKAKEGDSIVVGEASGHPARMLKNKFVRSLKKLEGDLEAYELAFAGGLKRACEGDCDEGSFMAGECSALVTQREPVATIISSLMKECESILGNQAQEILAANASRAFRAIKEQE